MYLLTLSFRLFRARDLDRALIQNEFFTGGLLSLILCFFTIPLSKHLPIFKDLYQTPTIAITRALAITLTTAITLYFYETTITPIVKDYVENHLSVNSSNIQYKTIYKNEINAHITIAKNKSVSDSYDFINTRKPFTYHHKIRLCREPVLIIASKHNQQSTIKIDDIIFKTRYESSEAKTHKEDADYSIHSIRLKTETLKESFFKFERVTTQTTAVVNTTATIKPETLQKIQMQTELDALLRYKEPSTLV